MALRRAREALHLQPRPAFQSRRDPGMALRLGRPTGEELCAKRFNPVVIRAWRCASTEETERKRNWSLFQSRRDPGMALRQGDRGAGCDLASGRFNPVVIRAWRCAAVADTGGDTAALMVSIPS